MVDPSGPHVGVLIVSDRRAAGEPDLAGPPLAARLAEVLPGCTVTTEIVPDEVAAIQAVLRRWCDVERVALALTSGGTGFAPRDVTPEATRALLERPAPGLVVAMIASGLAHTPHAMLGRPEAGIRKRTLVVNLPGSPRGALEALDALAPALPHALALLAEARDAEAGHRPADPAR
jgi:molybdenum cofactor synthesis domain-containing protein